MQTGMSALRNESVATARIAVVAERDSALTDRVITFRVTSGDVSPVHVAG